VFDQGTSLATAYVSGAAALLRAAHPAETPAQIRGRLLAATDALPGLSGGCVSGGRLNLRKALGVPETAPRLAAAGPPADGQFVLSLSGDPGRTYVTEVSTNLQEWASVSTNLAGLTGAIVFTNSLTGSPPRQFYRAWLTP
jgi:subtilisin family serine protease